MGRQISGKRVVGIIPARMGSKRFPGKPLKSILGKPLIAHVAYRVAEALGAENIIIATDDRKIIKVVQSYGFQAVLTSKSHLTGTDRVCEAARKVKADIFMNIQGDEPMVRPSDIKKVLKEKISHFNCVINGMCPLDPDEDPQDVNIPKVVFGSNKQLIYMSRLPIPGCLSKTKTFPEYWKQVCIYAFNKREMELYAKNRARGCCEFFEDIEILRFLQMGYPVRMVETEGGTYAVDTPSDIKRIECKMRSIVKIKSEP